MLNQAKAATSSAFDRSELSLTSFLGLGEIYNWDPPSGLRAGRAQLSSALSGLFLAAVSGVGVTFC